MKRFLLSLWMILAGVSYINAQEPHADYPQVVYFPETQVGTAYEATVQIYFDSGFTGGNYYYAALYTDNHTNENCPFSYKYNWENEFHPANEGGWGYCCAEDGMSYGLTIRFAPVETGDYTAYLHLYTQSSFIGTISLSGSATQDPPGVIPMSMDSISNIGTTAATANFTVNVEPYYHGDIVWGTSTSPVVTSDNSQDYNSLDNVSSVGIENLTPGTTYYVRGTVSYLYTYTTYQDPYYYGYPHIYYYDMTYFSNEVSFTTEAADPMPIPEYVVCVYPNHNCAAPYSGSITLLDIPEGYSYTLFSDENLLNPVGFDELAGNQTYWVSIITNNGYETVFDVYVPDEITYPEFKGEISVAASTYCTNDNGRI